MAQDITVTLSNEQVSKGLEYARKANPDATNQELRDALKHAAYWGPGIREQIAEWERAAVRKDQNDAAAAAQTEFLQTFPAEPEEETEV